jgi:hypothetical protein
MPEIDETRYLVNCSWQDVPHLAPSVQRKLLASTLPYLRDARSKGTPSLGAGAIYAIPEADFVIDPFAIPPYWPRAYGMDVGWNRTAACWAAIDRNTDTVYIYAEHYRGEAQPSEHVNAIKARGNWIPGVIDPASRGRDQIAGRQLLALYVEMGLRLSTADNGVDAGQLAVLERLSAGKLKVFRTCGNLLSEYRLYRRDTKGKIVKEHDHCLAPDTIVHTTDGRRRIADLVGTSGEVLTVGGEYTPYRDCRMTRADAPLVAVHFDDGSVVRCTPDHRFLTPSGWVEAQDMAGLMCYDAVSQRIKGSQLWNSELLSTPPHVKSSAGFGTTSAEDISSAMGSGSIGWFLRPRVEWLCRPAGTSTTSTATGPTISRKTWLCSMLATISLTIRRAMTGRLWRWPMNALRSGTPLPKARSGTASISRVTGMSCMAKPTSFASIAASSSNPRTLGATASAPTTAKPNHAGLAEPIMSSASAMRAAAPSPLIGTARPEPAPGHARRRCVAVTPAGRSAVYCLDVPATNAFAVEGGVVVHNCMDALRYLIISGLSIAQVKAAVRAPDVGPAFNSARGDARAGY